MLFHGTPRANLESILRDGLRPRSRHHVHLSADVPTALVRRPAPLGRRRGASRSAAGAMAADGHVFHRSDNGVWLTAEVPAGYLR